VRTLLTAANVAIGLIALAAAFLNLPIRTDSTNAARLAAPTVNRALGVRDGVVDVEELSGEVSLTYLVWFQVTLPRPSMRRPRLILREPRDATSKSNSAAVHRIRAVS
jgi:hypothetical protein